MTKSKEEKIYLDYAATTPTDERVVEAMLPFFNERFGNPGSLHGLGQESIKAVDSSRETLADSLGADFREIVFTGSATEANNIALRGVVRKALSDSNFDSPPRIIVSEIEHDAVLETAKELEKKGVDLVTIPVDSDGVVDLKKIKKSLTDDTVLVFVMYANNETGVIQPIEEISEIISEYKSENEQNLYPLFHTDAVQAFQFLDCDIDNLGVDLMTLSAHKIYGPKGIGALFLNNEYFKSNNKPIESIITGGGQEFGLRSGTENVPSIVGFAKAVELIDQNKNKYREEIENLRDKFLNGIKEISSDIEVNGKGGKIPNILNLYLPGLSSEDLLIKLDMKGICVSSGAACSARSTKSSHVLSAMSYSSKRIDSSIRFSFGRPTTEKEIEKALKIIEDIIK